MTNELACVQYVVEAASKESACAKLMRGELTKMAIDEHHLDEIIDISEIPALKERK
jgi:hypothetical protein